MTAHKWWINSDFFRYFRIIEQEKNLVDWLGPKKNKGKKRQKETRNKKSNKNTNTIGKYSGKRRQVIVRIKTNVWQSRSGKHWRWSVGGKTRRMIFFFLLFVLLYKSKLRDDERMTAADADVARPPAGAIDALERFLARSFDNEFSAMSARSSASSN